jgi:hypothetical protein
MPSWASIVLCIFLLLDEHVEGDVYGFGVKDVEITKVAEKAEMAERVRIIWMTTRHVIWPVTEYV